MSCANQSDKNLLSSTATVSRCQTRGEIALFGSSLDFEYFSKDRKVANRFWIHKDGRLTADTEVPKGLIVTGYSAPYYYSQVFDANGHF